MAPIYTQCPLTDLYRHFFRVVRYMRPYDYAVGAAMAAGTPLALVLMERRGPTYTSRATFSHISKLATGLGLCAGFLPAYSLSARESLCQLTFQHAKVGC